MKQRQAVFLVLRLRHIFGTFWDWGLFWGLEESTRRRQIRTRTQGLCRCGSQGATQLNLTGSLFARLEKNDYSHSLSLRFMIINGLAERQEMQWSFSWSLFWGEHITGMSVWSAYIHIAGVFESVCYINTRLCDRDSVKKRWKQQSDRGFGPKTEHRIILSLYNLMQPSSHHPKAVYFKNIVYAIT